MATNATGRDDAADPRREPNAIAERVVFRLWASGDANARSIEQARQEIDARTRLDQALVRLGLVDEVECAKALAAEIGAPYAGDSDYPACPIALDMLPQRFVRESLALPLADDGQTLRVAVADPLDDYTRRAIALKTKRRVEIACAAPARLEREIARIYGARDAGVLTAPAAPQTLAPMTPQAPVADAAPRPTPQPAPAELGAAAKELVRDFARRKAQPALEAAPEAAPSPETERPARAPAAAAPQSVKPPTPRFVRPKRVTLKRPDRPHRDAARAPSPKAPVAPSKPAQRDAAPRGGAMLVAAAVARNEQAREAAARSKTARAQSDDAERAATQRPEADDAGAQDMMARFEAAMAKKAASAAAPVRVAAAPREAQQRKPSMLEAFAETQPFARRPETAQRPISEPVPETPSRPALARQDDRDLDQEHAQAMLRAREGARRLAPTPEPGRESRREPRPDAAPRSTAERKPMIASYIGSQFSPDAPREDETASRPEPTRTLRTTRLESAQKRDFVIGEVRRKLRESLAAVETPAARRVPQAPLRARSRPETAAAPTEAQADANATGDLRALGFDRAAEAALTRALSASQGLVLICGLAGSGKVATRNAVAASLAAEGVAVRPLETVGAGEQPRSRKSNTRRAAIGAIRSADDAEAAARAAMTGWLVVVTLEAPTVAAAAPQLIRMGVPPYVLASSLRAAVSQRAVSASDAEALGVEGEAVAGAVTAIQAVEFDDDMRALVLAQADETAFCAAMGVAAPIAAEALPRRSGPPRPLTAGVPAP